MIIERTQPMQAIIFAFSILYKYFSSRATRIFLSKSAISQTAITIAIEADKIIGNVFQAACIAPLARRTAITLNPNAGRAWVKMGEVFNF